MVPLLGVTDDLMLAVRLEGKKRVDYLFSQDESSIIRSRARGDQAHLGWFAFRVTVIGDVLVDQDLTLGHGRRVLEQAEGWDIRPREQLQVSSAYGFSLTVSGCMRQPYLRKTVELSADGFDALSDTYGVVEDRLRRIYLVRAL